MKEKFLITSESVTEGHPDKIADQISDGVLDACLAQDPESRVACEVLVTTGLVLISGEITTKAHIDYSALARGVIADVGYTRGKFGFDCDNCSVITSLGTQSPDIALGVDTSLEAKEESSVVSEELIGAGDQGMMIGFATDETPEMLPLPFALAQRLARRLTACRKEGRLPYLRPDGKTQVTLEYDEEGVALRAEAIVVSSQHDPEVDIETLRTDIKAQVIDPVMPPELMKGTRILINPTGRFIQGGPHADTGLTGRKIIVDTYGGMVPHGGGAFSGKDPTKVDRSAAYMARYAAKNLVAAGLAKKAQIQVAYAIGVAEPVSLTVNTFGTGIVSDDKLVAALKSCFDFRPAGIINSLRLREPHYRRLAAYGHMGRIDLNPTPTWERTDKVGALKSFLGL